MVYIFHGENQKESRAAFSDFLSKISGTEILRLDNKTATFEIINLFLQSESLFSTEKTLVITNYFSVVKTIQDKLTKLSLNSNHTIVIWQDKLLTASQLKIFPNPKVFTYKLDNKIFKCLNAVQPKNLKVFLPLYHQIIKEDYYDLFLYLLKNSIRKQLTNYSRFNGLVLKKTYLHLIELDYQNKTGQLSIPKEIALERTLTNLLK